MFKSQPGLLRVRNFVFVALTVFGLFVWFSLTRQCSQMSLDFAQDYNAAKNLLESTSIYSPNIRNFHPPFQALFFLPFTALSYPAAFWLLSIISLASYVGILATSIKAADLAPRTLLVVMPFALLWYPFIHTIAEGQTSIVIAFLLLFGWRQIQEGRQVAAGALWGLAALLKLFPAFALFYLLFAKKPRVLISTVVFFCAGNALALLAVGAPDFERYFAAVAPADLKMWAPYVANISLRGVIGPIFENSSWSQAILPSATLEFYAILAAVLAAIAFAWHDCKRLFSRGYPAHAFSIVVFAMLFVSPITWVHMLVIVPFPFALVLSDIIKGGSSRVRRHALAALLLITVPVYWVANAIIAHFGNAPLPYYYFVIEKCSFLGLLLLWRLISNPASNNEWLAQCTNE